MSVAKTEGLRARKKRAARKAIAATARRLFAERGFDAVTVAEVAAAAEVSEKTVFNHFPTKEDLAFADREDGLNQLVAAITRRGATVGVLDVFRTLTDTTIDNFSAPEHPELLTVAKILRHSPALRERLAAGWESGAEAVTAAIAATTEAGEDDLVPGIVARTLWWTHRSIFLAGLHGLLADEDRQQLVERLRASAEHAYDRLGAGLGDYGRIASG